jgi:hypothetical protein
MCDCGQIVHGAVGLAKAALGVDRADEETIQKRRAICRECPHAIPCPLLANKKCRCELCGCLLSAKTVVAGEVCPDDPRRW